MTKQVFCFGHGLQCDSLSVLTMSNLFGVSSHTNITLTNNINVIFYTYRGETTSGRDLFSKIYHYHKEHINRPLVDRCNALRMALQRESYDGDTQIKQQSQQSYEQTPPPIICNLFGNNIPEHKLYPLTKGQWDGTCMSQLHESAVDDPRCSIRFLPARQENIISESTIALSEIIKDEVQKQRKELNKDIEIHWCCCRAFETNPYQFTASYKITGDIPIPTPIAHIPPIYASSPRRHFMGETIPIKLSFPNIQKKKKFWDTSSHTICLTDSCKNPTGFNKRHHCRICGDGHFCDKCAPKRKMHNDQKQYVDRIRVCVTCSQAYSDYIDS